MRWSGQRIWGCEEAANSGCWLLANSAFIVRPDKSFVAVLGIVAANSYFYTLAVTLAFKVVHGILQRSRITELGISHRSIDEDDDDL